MVKLMQPCVLLKSGWRENIEVNWFKLDYYFYEIYVGKAASNTIINQQSAISNSLKSVFFKKILTKVVWPRNSQKLPPCFYVNKRLKKLFLGLVYDIITFSKCIL